MKTRPLSSFLARLIWLCMAPPLLLAAWLAWDNLQEREARYRGEGEHLAKNYATSVDQYLRARLNALNMLAISPLADDPGRWRELYEEARGFQQSYDSHVIFADTARQMRFNTRTPYGTKLPLLPVSKGRSAAPLALETGQPQIGDIVMGPIDAIPLVAIVVPGIRQGLVTHLMLTIVETAQLQRRLDVIAMPAGWSLALIDGTGADIARRSPVGFDSARDVADDHRFVIQSELSPWSVVLEIPRRSQRDALHRSMLILGIALVLTTLLGWLGGTLAGRRISHQVAMLGKPAAAFSPPPDIAEFSAALTRLDEAKSAERASDERFALLFAQAPVPMVLVDGAGRIVTHNARFLQVFGYPPSDLPSMAHWWQLAYPDPAYRAREQAEWGASVAQAVTIGNEVPSHHSRVTCKDGSSRDILLSGIVLANGVLASFVDITALKQIEQTLATAVEEQKAARLAALNQMEDANAARRETLELNTNLERRVMERTAELTAANQELDAFAYAVSHDLRAPLRAMLGFSQALLEDCDEQLRDDARLYLDQIGIASRKMGELIDGLLALSRSTRAELQRSRVDLSALATKHLADLASTDPGRRVTVKIEPELVVWGDARMLDAVLANLLGNAWKYTAKTLAPAIHFTRGEIDGRPAYCVIDNGAGFDSAHAERLFKPFQRLHRQDEFPGIGIGLATVQRIILRHGGTLIASGQPGKGATFCFTLPENTAQDHKT